MKKTKKDLKKASKKKFRVTYAKKEKVVFAKPKVEDNPFLTNPKFDMPDGVLIHACLAYAARILFGQGRENQRNDLSNYLAMSAEAFGCRPHGRLPSEKQMTEIVRKVFSILTKNNRRKVCHAMHGLIFWPGFNGGFLHSPNSSRF